MPKLYPSNLKNREFDKEAPQNFCLERVTIAGRQGTSEDKDSEVKPTRSKTDSSGCLGIHIANTFFEWELETDQKCSLSEAFLQHAIFRQLQFLPALYAAPNEGILLSDLPEENYWATLQKKGISPPKAFNVSDSSFSPYTEIESWGASRLIAEFASKHQLTYCMPEWEVVRKTNSKQFSFESSPKLPHATLLNEETEAKHWLESFEGRKVLKTCYGVSGKGHLIIDDQIPWERIAHFLKIEWKKQLPVIAEPWMHRVLDFSTQWLIDEDKKIAYVGATLCENNERGQYRFNTVGDEKTLFNVHLPFLKEHIKIAHPILSKIAELGFFGNIGIDAMLYTNPNQPSTPILHPIVEINARKTMGWVALMMQKKHHPERMLRIGYSPGVDGFLPQAVIEKTGKVFPFSRNLAIAVYN